MIVLHYLKDSRAFRIAWLLEELGLTYEVKMYNRDPKTHLAPPELRNIHFSGKSPVIEDDGRVVAESGLICEYLVGKYGKNTELYPRNEDDELVIKYGLYACEGSLMIPGMMLYIDHMARATTPIGISSLVGAVTGRIEARYAKPEAEHQLRNLQKIINDNGGYYAGGRLTGADIMYHLSLSLIRYNKLVPDFDEVFPGLVKWMDRVSQRPAFKVAAEKFPMPRL